jgi:hypothetical protein
MATPADATVAALESKLDQASADLADVKRAASIAGGIMIGGGILYIVWRLFTHRVEEPTDGS